MNDCTLEDASGREANGPSGQVSLFERAKRSAQRTNTDVVDSSRRLEDNEKRVFCKVAARQRDRASSDEKRETLPEPPITERLLDPRLRACAERLEGRRALLFLVPPIADSLPLPASSLLFSPSYPQCLISARVAHLSPATAEKRRSARATFFFGKSGRLALSVLGCHICPAPAATMRRGPELTESVLEPSKVEAYDAGPSDVRSQP
ncbi:hypothetical protein MRX96_015103 [Rhipicephalus microplus]